VNPIPPTLTISVPATWGGNANVVIGTAQGNVLSGAVWNGVFGYKCDSIYDCSPTLVYGSWIEVFSVTSATAFSSLTCPDGSIRLAGMVSGGNWMSICDYFTMNSNKTITLNP
jgi:hypothetical protein